MIDSGQVVRPVAFPPGEVERVTEDFLGHESIKPYVATPVLREKAARLIARYYAYMARTVDDAVIAGDIYGLVTTEPGEHRDAEGRLFVSRAGWATVTRGHYVQVTGNGDHNHMLAPPHLAPNAARLGGFLVKIFSTDGKKSPASCP
jgi:thioesterase domain-containing protein